MGLFTELYALTRHTRLAMLVTADHDTGKMTISVMPRAQPGAQPALSTDLTLTATPEEFGASFLAALIGYSRQLAPLLEQATATSKALAGTSRAAAQTSRISVSLPSATSARLLAHFSSCVFPSPKERKLASTLIYRACGLALIPLGRDQCCLLQRRRVLSACPVWHTTFFLPPVDPTFFLASSIRCGAIFKALTLHRLMALPAPLAISARSLEAAVTLCRVRCQADTAVLRYGSWPFLASSTAIY